MILVEDRDGPYDPTIGTWNGSDRNRRKCGNVVVDPSWWHGRHYRYWRTILKRPLLERNRKDIMGYWDLVESHSAFEWLTKMYLKGKLKLNGETIEPPVLRGYDDDPRHYKQGL